jgi:hypothetical protein
VELKPETELLVQEELRSGHVQSVDEIIIYGVHALREKQRMESSAAAGSPRKHIYDLLTQPPFASSGLKIERQKDFPRPVNL